MSMLLIFNLIISFSDIHRQTASMKSCNAYESTWNANVFIWNLPEDGHNGIKQSIDEDMEQLRAASEEKKRNEINPNLVEDILNSYKDLFGKYLKNPKKYEIQILYTQINRDENNTPSFQSYSYNMDSKKYFYPASSIKLSACVLALEKLNNLQIDGVDKYCTVKIGATRYSQTATTGTIANYIKNVLLVSDNLSFNRLYEFLGQKYYNETLLAKGYENVQILHRLQTKLPVEENKHTNPFTFYKNNKVIYSQAAAYNDQDFRNKSGLYDYMRAGDNFSGKNFFSIQDLQDILKAVMFPNEILPEKRFNLTEEDYSFLRKYLATTPRQGGYQYSDSFTKFFMVGDSDKPLPSNIKMFSKSGIAWGYMIDNAYIVDKSKGIEFLLTAVVHDGTIDNNNNYSGVNRPFLGNLGRVVYEYEKARLKVKR